jgi:hypothetical protein
MTDPGAGELLETFMAEIATPADANEGKKANKGMVKKMFLIVLLEDIVLKPF